MTQDHAMESLVSTGWLAGELGKPGLVVLDCTTYLPNEPGNARDGFRAAQTRATAADGLRSLLYLEEQTAARLQREETPVAAPLFAPPEAPRLEGTEFLEFAVIGTLLDDLLCPKTPCGSSPI